MQWDRCVWIMKNRAKWAPQHGQITNIWLSDRCEGKLIPAAKKFGYDRHESESYLGNIG